MHRMYLDFYGLVEPPFHVTPDPRFMCWTVHHREGLDHLLYGIRARKGFIQITGEVGTGKTTLCRACLAELEDEVDTALVLNPLLTPVELLQAIIHDFGLDYSLADANSWAYVQRLNEYLLERNAQGRNVVVFIDEAQDLSSAAMEQVRLLSNLETDREKLIQVVLCGQPELNERLQAPDLRQLRQRIAVRYQLGALDEKDTARYIGHRLGVAARTGQAPSVSFSASALWMIFAHSKGCPRLINAVADHALLAGYAEGRRLINDHCVRRGLAQLEGETS